MALNLLRSARLLASDRHKLAAVITFNNQIDLENFRTAESPIFVEKKILVESTFEDFRWKASAIHSKCVNNLFPELSGDISIICDYDTAFVKKDWDLEIVSECTAGKGRILGAPYSHEMMIEWNLPFGTIRAMKYQKKPNLIFFAYLTDLIPKNLSVLCNFENKFNSKSDIPIEFISNIKRSCEVGLPVGSWLSADTGTEIPHIIHSRNIEHSTFTRRTSDYRVLSLGPYLHQAHPLHLPEEYDWKSNPFLVHFRKGSTKPDDNSTNSLTYTRDKFIFDVSSNINAVRGA